MCVSSARAGMPTCLTSDKTAFFRPSRSSSSHPPWARSGGDILQHAVDSGRPTITMGLGNIAAWSRICLLWRTPPFAGHAKKSRTTEDRRGNREEGERDQEGYPHPLPPLVLSYAAQLTVGPRSAGRMPLRSPGRSRPGVFWRCRRSASGGRTCPSPCTGSFPGTPRPSPRASSPRRRHSF